MAYTPPGYAHLPDVVWAPPAAPVVTQKDTGGGLATRGDIEAVASTPSDTQAQVAAENAPLRVIYGAPRIGAQLADALVYQGNLVVVAVWGQGEVDAISQVWMGDAALPANVTATHYTGTAGQTADATLIAAYAAAGVTYADALPGVAYSVFVVPAGDSQGFPTFTATVRGLKVYDPRSTTTAWSDNPALCLADFIGSTTYGWGRTVDWASVETAADACDELVTTGHKRRLIGLALESVRECRQWVEALRTYAGCFVVPGAEGYRLIPDRPAASVMTFTSGTIVAGSMRLKKRGVRQVPTVLEVRYTDTGVLPWAEKSAIVKAAGVDAGTTPRRESRVSLPGILRYAQAWREAVERYNHLSLEDLEASWETFDEALALDVGDVVTVSHPVGLTAKLMRVTAVSSRAAGRWTVAAREYDPAVYSDSVEAEPTYADTALPNPASPPAVTALTLVEEVFQSENGTYASRMRATWAAAEYPYLANFRVELWAGATLIHTTTTREAEWATPTVQEGLIYTVKVVAVSTIGTVGTWATESASAAGKYLIPGDVPSITGFEAGGKVYLYWEPATDIDIWRYELRYGSVGVAWEDARMLNRIDALRFVAQDIPVGTWTIHVKALDSVGQYSANAATVTLTITSDAAAFLVDSYDCDSPSITGMSEYRLNRHDGVRHWVTEDAVAFGTKFTGAMASYTAPLASYHASMTSEWMGEAEDFGQMLGGDWTGTASAEAVSGAIASEIGTSPDGSAWTYHGGLTAKTNARFARLRHQALTTATLHCSVPSQSVRLDAVPREEVGTGTSSTSAAVTVTLENEYTATKKITITPEGATARMATYDNVVTGSPTTFDVHVFDAAGNRIASPFRYAYQGV